MFVALEFRFSASSNLNLGKKFLLATIENGHCLSVINSAYQHRGVDAGQRKIRKWHEAS